MQSDFIKFRVTADEKRSLVSAAREADVTVSALLRRAGRAVIGGRIASGPVLVDLVAVRRAANLLAAIADDATAEPEKIAAAMKAAANDLRKIAARHLATVK
jgi:hypothetical protein